MPLIADYVFDAALATLDTEASVLRGGHFNLHAGKQDFAKRWRFRSVLRGKHCSTN